MKRKIKKNKTKKVRTYGRTPNGKKGLTPSKNPSECRICIIHVCNTTNSLKYKRRRIRRRRRIRKDKKRRIRRDVEEEIEKERRKRRK